jgi:c-di-GMP-binding flagellar brake protein YcgR
MLAENIKTGTRVEITPKRRLPNEKPHLSMVETVVNDKKVMIHAPAFRGEPIRLPKNENYVLRFLTENAVFRFDALLQEYVNVDGFEVILFQISGEGDKIQRRGLFRFTCAIPVTFTVVSENGDQSETQEGMIRDLSGGGMKMLSRLNMQEKSLIRVMLQLEDDYIMAFGEVLAKSDVPDSIYEFQYGVKFAVMPEADQEKIIRFLYNEQRKLRMRTQ